MPPADPFQTAATLRRLLTEAGLRPRHRRGQNFLIDRNLMMKLVAAAVLTLDDIVLEVGTGAGSLTGLLADRAGRVHTFEIDDQLAGVAESQLAGRTNVTMHRGDALQSQTVLAPAISALIAEHPGRVKLVANLPYDVATPLLMGLLLAPSPPVSMCFTIQREVGLRLLAEPGTRDYGPASVLTRTLTTTQRIAAVTPQSFWPQPKVDSVMLRLTSRAPAMPHEARAQLAGLARHAFQFRRKKLRPILIQQSTEAAAAAGLTAAGLLGDERPEQVTPAQWVMLAAAMRTSR